MRCRSGRAGLLAQLWTTATRRCPVCAPVLVAMLLAVTAHAVRPSDAADPAEPKTVLILLPGQPGLPAALAVAAGVRSVLLAARRTALSIETENVDAARFRGTDYEHHLRALFGFKYGGRPLDAIVVVGNEPLDFVLRARGELWPDVPVVVCAVDERTVGGFAQPSRLALITIRYDMAGTLAAALRLLPDTRHVALVGGAAPSEQAFHELGRRAARELGPRVSLIELIGLPIEETLARLSRLPERTVVLVSSFQVDGNGNRFYGVDLVGPMSAASSAPLFTIFGTVLGLGPVGGSMVDFESVGREAGGRVLRTLEGEPAAERAQSAASNALRFDARQLQRWRLDESRLPPGSQVLYRNPGIWEQYRWYMVGAVCLLAGQAALIAGLLIERRRRQQAQGDLLQRVRFEALLERISTTLARAPSARLDAQIRECLGWIVSFLDVERGTLWQPSPDRRVVISTHHWTASGAEPPPPSMEVAKFRPLWNLFDKGEGIAFTTPAELGSDTDASRRALEQVGVRSLVAIPLRIGDRTLGLLAFTTLREVRGWPGSLLQQLQPLSEVFANALMREQAAADLESSEALLAAVLTALPAETAILDGRGKIVHVNEAWSAAAHDAPADARAAMEPGGDYLQACRAGVAVSEDRAAKALELLEAVLHGRQTDAAMEYASLYRGGERWREMRVQHISRPEGAAVMHFDITDRKRAEAEARQHLAQAAHTDRVAALGELASSLAHELNQPLTAILTNAQAAQRLLAATPPRLDDVRECLTDMISADRRAGEVIRRVRQLLKKEDAAELVPLHLNALVANMIDVVSNEAMLRRVSIDFSPAPALPAVRADSVQIQQVVLNLLMNAIAAAAGERGRRTVSVWTASVKGDVELGVHDSGAGLPDKDAERIFEPFFTTKPEGLGMGLAISRSIVHAHGGRIWAEDAAGGGATLRVRFPGDGGRPLSADESVQATPGTTPG